MSSRRGSLTNFNGEPREEGLFLNLAKRGDPAELLGESGGALPAGNKEADDELPAIGLDAEEEEEFGKDVPALASSINDFTCAIKNSQI